MKGSTAELEERVTRVLGEAARRLEVPVVVWGGPSRPRRSPRWRRGRRAAVPVLGVAVAIGLAALALLVVRTGHAPVTATGTAGGLPPAPAQAFEPALTAGEARQIDAAWRATTSRDPACRGANEPRFISGSPPASLTSLFAILRGRAMRRAGRVQGLLRHDLPGLLSVRGMYLDQIHLARTFAGASFYVIPAADVTGQAGVPARCSREQVAYLQQRLTRLTPVKRAAILAAQARDLVYLRYLATHPAGVCALWLRPDSKGIGIGDDFGCARPADIGRWGVLAVANAPLGRNGVFWTVVPDAVDTVTLTFAPGRGIPALPGGRRITETVAPVDNVVLAAEPPAASFPAQMVLRGTGERVLKRVRVTPSMPVLCGFGC